MVAGPRTGLQSALRARLGSHVLRRSADDPRLEELGVAWGGRWVDFGGVRVGRGWERGRQLSGYDKLLLVEGRRFDVYLLRFGVGSEVPLHRDPVVGAGHLRLNLILVAARLGGEFECAQAMVDRPRVKLFRSDLHAHAVTKIEAGTRWVLSIGFALREH